MTSDQILYCSGSNGPWEQRPLVEPRESEREIFIDLGPKRVSISHWGLIEVSRRLMFVPKGYKVSGDLAELDRVDGIIELCRV